MRYRTLSLRREHRRTLLVFLGLVFSSSMNGDPTYYGQGGCKWSAAKLVELANPGERCSGNERNIVPTNIKGPGLHSLQRSSMAGRLMVTRSSREKNLNAWKRRPQDDHNLTATVVSQGGQM